MIDIAISGAAGRMGRAAVEAALADGLVLKALIEAPGSAAIGQVLHGVMIGDRLTERVDAVIDFSSPAGAMARLADCLAHKAGLVVGTTGLTDDHRRRLQAAGSTIPVLVSSNMSIGVNVLVKVIPEIVRLLGAGFDIEEVEAHHRHKKDAPSGTAMLLADATGRKIPIHSVRAGGIVGEHRLLFASEGEQIEVAHTALTRSVFAAGAVRAARFVSQAKPGFYGMAQALGV